jgi:putative RecB family exonuclease
MSTPFVNQHLSVSRLKLLERCALAFYFQYVSPGERESRGGAPEFGTILHAALERTYQWIVGKEFSGPFPTDELIRAYQEAWQEGKLTGVHTFQEGLHLLRSYARSHPVVNHWDILAIEQEFNINLGGYTVNGFIDRVDRLGPRSIAIVDYKSNRLLFTREELEGDLQMSMYGIVARRLYPWAERISFVFHMLRHDTHQGTERTAQELDDAAGYVIALGTQSETQDREWLPTLNPLCGYCDHRRRCPAYAQALAGKHEVTAVENWEDWEEIARKRETYAALAKLMYRRKDELDAVIRAKIEQDGEFEAAGSRYRYISGGTSVTYQEEEVVRLFAAYGIPPDQTLRGIRILDPGAVEAFREEVSKTLPRVLSEMLKASLDTMGDRVPNAQRLISSPVKKVGTAKKVAS